MTKNFTDWVCMGFGAFLGINLAEWLFCSMGYIPESRNVAIAAGLLAFAAHVGIGTFFFVTKKTESK